MWRSSAPSVIFALFVSAFLGADGEGGPGYKDRGIFSYLDHAGATGTQHNRKESDPLYFTSNSRVPLLPTLHGYMATHGTYRFLHVVEQVLTLIGEPKHGLWRVQESGFVREYRKKGKPGLNKDVDPNSKNLTDDQMRIIRENYGSFLPDEKWDGYKYPDQKITTENQLNFIDLSVYHPKYNNKYDAHVPIDLAHYYCTFSQADYPHIWDTWKYVTAQPLANKIGPLGKRAGIDVKENYLNAIRMDLFPDAGIWINIGVNDSATDFKRNTLEELAQLVPQTINFQRADTSKMKHEIYVIERPFFNMRYLFVTVIVDLEAADGSSKHSYVRPDGHYWEGLKSRNMTNMLGTQILHYPEFPIEGIAGPQIMKGIPLYGHHHPDRLNFSLTGGACPDAGGDWAYYPWGDSGSGWPTNYQEIGPLCDGVVLDTKAWTNLWSKTWADDRLGLGNAGFDRVNMDYRVQPNVYGRFTDPYLINIGAKNPYFGNWTHDGKTVGKDDPKPDPIIVTMNYTKLGTLIGFNKVPDLGLGDPKSLLDSCPKTSCPTERPTEMPTQKPTSNPNDNEEPTHCPNEDDKVPEWAIAIIILQILLILLLVVAIVLACAGAMRTKNKASPSSAETHDNGGYRA